MKMMQAETLIVALIVAIALQWSRVAYGVYGELLHGQEARVTLGAVVPVAMRSG